LATPSVVDESEIVVEIADTQEERTQGLSGRASLPQDHVLLFVFPQKDYWGIWMKDMKFPIDIMWLDENYRVVDMKVGAIPESYPEAFRPQSPALYVVEANVEFINTNRVAKGDILELQK